MMRGLKRGKETSERYDKYNIFPTGNTCSRKKEHTNYIDCPLREREFLHFAQKFEIFLSKDSNIFFFHFYKMVASLSLIN